MADKKLPSGRMLSQWQNCDPSSMEAMSKSAIRYALGDAKTDILALADRVAELERASQPGSGDVVDCEWFDGSNVWGSSGEDWLEFLRFYQYAPSPMIECLRRQIDAARASLDGRREGNHD